jgi:geranylgeranyl reductase family protein
MDTCDVLIVGGGPAGSSCAWRLRNSGLDVVVLDKQVFPRDKVCGGWITPAVLSELDIDSRDYSQGRVFQPITGFRTGCIGRGTIETNYGVTVSYGIRRREFDEYLLRRSGARLLEGVDLTKLERRESEWIANGGIRARLVVGAGGHFCPVARLTGKKTRGENAVVAQEAEFEMDAQQRAGCEVSPELPELYFCSDFKGYGWCFRKQNFLNVGLGRMDPHRLSEHVAAFLRFLKSAGRIKFDVSHAFLGHAYLLYGTSTRNLADDGLLLIGDAAGLAYSQSGEGIRPAIESGLLAAKAILAADGKYDRAMLESYGELLTQRFGGSREHWATKIGRHLPPRMIQSLGERLLGMRWFARDVVISRWFLHAGEPALEC